MKVVLQNLDDMHYLTSEAEWTPDPNAARDFCVVARALDFALVVGLRSARIIIMFEDGREDLALPPVKLHA